MTTILHVEDDPALAEMVEESFVAFGFTGTYLTAETVHEARDILDDLATYPQLDLVISDMNLPDGSGLDVVGSVRSNGAREFVPIIILSGDTSPATVNRAYAVGVNSFVGKGTRGRSLMETMKALYGHWLRDARLPRPDGVTRTRQAIARAVLVRTHKAELYMRVAEQLGPATGEFWMDLALREGNLANVLTFLRDQLGDRELPADLLALTEAVQRAELRTLDELDAHPTDTPLDVQDVIRAMIQNYNADVVTRVTAALFPVVPVAMTTLQQIAASTLEEIADWIERHASDPRLCAEVPNLRADAAHMRAPRAVEAV